MAGRRELATTLPSPSELDEWDLCYFSWLMKYRQGVERIESKMGLVVGKALDKAVNVHYTRASSPLEVFEQEMGHGREVAKTVDDEEWYEWYSQGKALVELYVSTIPVMAPDWAEIVAVQQKLLVPAPCRPDLILRMKAGHLAVLEGKMENGWADIEYENLKYEMSWQALLYPQAVALAYGEPVKEVIMEYRQRGKPAKGKYKATAPQIIRHSIPVEAWKAEMWRASAEMANRVMVPFEQYAETPGTLVQHIPRRTRNCIQKFGQRAFPCPFLAACQVNVHPLDLPDLYEIPEWKHERAIGVDHGGNPT